VAFFVRVVAIGGEARRNPRHAEEWPKATSRSTHDLAIASFETPRMTP
jgi:hypothetical protein